MRCKEHVRKQQRKDKEKQEGSQCLLSVLTPARSQHKPGTCSRRDRGGMEVAVVVVVVAVVATATAAVEVPIGCSSSSSSSTTTQDIIKWTNSAFLVFLVFCCHSMLVACFSWMEIALAMVIGIGIANKIIIVAVLVVAICQCLWLMPPTLQAKNDAFDVSKVLGLYDCLRL